MAQSFRDQIVERLRIHLSEAEVPRETLESLASEIVFILERSLDTRSYDSAARQILQRYAEEWSEQSSRRILEEDADGAAGLVHELADRQGRNRAMRALRRTLMGTLEGVERPLDDLGFFEDDDV
ncbi:MAG: hypothetical protein V3V56_08270 [bacterium]